MIAQSVAEIVSHHVRLTVEGIDRMYLNVFVPGLQYEPGIVRFFREHRGQPLPSAALMSPMTRRPTRIYYNVSRTHRALNKDAPLHRAIERLGAVVSRPVLGGLHHQYCRI
jgi:hypothetical protein